MCQVEAMIQLRHLSKTYQPGVTAPVIADLSLTVADGEFLAITGPSGSGKSTLLNLIGTLDAPTQGEVILNGIPTGSLKGDALADFRLEHIGFIFQAFHLIPALTALENVMLPLIPHRRRLGFDLAAQARSLLGSVGLEGRLSHLPAQLSGGEQQRVAIARALVNTPRIILADEPTGNLDSKAGAEVGDLLHELNVQRGMTVVLVTHNETLARRAGRVIGLQDGRIVPSG